MSDHCINIQCSHKKTEIDYFADFLRHGVKYICMHTEKIHHVIVM